MSSCHVATEGCLQADIFSPVWEAFQGAHVVIKTKAAMTMTTIYAKVRALLTIRPPIQADDI